MGGLACKAKILMDSGRAAAYAQEIKEIAKDTNAEVFADEAAAYLIIKKLIEAEHALEAAHDLFLDAIDYHGPRP